MHGHLNVKLKIPSTAQHGGVLSLEYPSMHSRPYGAPRPVACDVYKGTGIEELNCL